MSETDQTVQPLLCVLSFFFLSPPFPEDGGWEGEEKETKLELHPAKGGKGSTSDRPKQGCDERSHLQKPQTGTSS